MDHRRHTWDFPRHWPEPGHVVGRPGVVPRTNLARCGSPMDRGELIMSLARGLYGGTSRRLVCLWHQELPEVAVFDTYVRWRWWWQSCEHMLVAGPAASLRQLACLPGSGYHKRPVMHQQVVKGYHFVSCLWSAWTHRVNLAKKEH